ncbi:sensor histidine kinase [Arthrobacter sp. ERGS1:01]|uniref:sensor histidine kinase n=1 Tax=Arthrobacter sp. ERGS1:01 TaxID=1704044 RepID=UPI001364AADA|nr:HAMP domain-containing sensor histidine kinase [Arthrobacter sp. ERGS1:01]
MGALLYSIVAASSAEAMNKSLTNATQVDSPRDAPAGVYVAISDDGRLSASPVMPPGLPDTDTMNRVAASHSDEQGDFSVAGRTYQVLTIFRGDSVVQAAVDTHEGREALKRLVWAMVVAVATAALLAAASSVWMARRAMRPLVESLALQRRFVADASHELRTPLTLLSTRAQLLRRKLAGTGLPPEGVSTEVARIVEDSKMLTGILDDLLISADPRGAVDHTAVDLVGVANSAVDLASPQALKQAIRLDSVGAGGPVKVLGSPVALLRVFTSLISNALDHAETAVSVEVGVRGMEARIVVTDDGPGFAPGTESRVFERFSSARPGAGGSGGTRHYGLGLALVAEIVALHNGKIMVEPIAPGAGAAVVVVLPVLRKRIADVNP